MFNDNEVSIQGGQITEGVRGEWWFHALHRNRAVNFATPEGGIFDKVLRFFSWWLLKVRIRSLGPSNVRMKISANAENNRVIVKVIDAEWHNILVLEHLYGEISDLLRKRGNELVRPARFQRLRKRASVLIG